MLATAHVTIKSAALEAALRHRKCGRAIIQKEQKRPRDLSELGTKSARANLVLLLLVIANSR
jgi:hypothetical protein